MNNVAIYKIEDFSNYNLPEELKNTQFGRLFQNVQEVGKLVGKLINSDSEICNRAFAFLEASLLKLKEETQAVPSEKCSKCITLIEEVISVCRDYTFSELMDF